MGRKYRDINCIAIIPARYGSTRLEGKPLIELNGKPIIQHVWENANQSNILSDIYIATDNDKIKSVVEDFGGKVIMTPAELQSGTDRIAYAYNELNLNADIILNIQGDEPFLKPETIDLLLSRFMISISDVGTLITKIKTLDDLLDPSKVKVVMKHDNNALYFSRSPIPFLRDYPQENWLKMQDFWKHIGVYAYRPESLEKFSMLEPTELEMAESLEQLRLIQNQFQYLCVETDQDIFGIDTKNDLEKAQELL